MRSSKLPSERDLSAEFCPVKRLVPVDDVFTPESSGETGSRDCFFERSRVSRGLMPEDCRGSFTPEPKDCGDNWRDDVTTGAALVVAVAVALR